MESGERGKKQFYYVSVLSVISALAVVILHSNTAFWLYREDGAWLFNNVVESLFYFAVPIFFMITGVTLFDYQDRYDTKTFFKHRFSKVLIPFIFWSFFGLFFYGVLREQRFSLDFVSIWNDFFGHQYVGIFWFFLPLICIYLSVPLFASIEKKKKDRIMIYLAGAGLFINVLIPFILSVIGFFCEKKLVWGFALDVVGGFLIYPILGYILHEKELTQKQRYWIYGLAICGLSVHMLGTYYLSRHDGMIVDLFKGYKNLPCILYSMGIFVFIKQISNYKILQKMKKLVLYLSKYTFAFYLIHSFVLVYLTDMFVSIGISATSKKYVLLAFILTIPICLVLTWLIRKIPGGKKILP
ncbi:acyltransferase [Candidatus Saccharibacteria bacterium]|nr:acyltransferase [Candidatus Saccharibacteria bacterium]